MVRKSPAAIVRNLLVWVVEFLKLLGRCRLHPVNAECPICQRGGATFSPTLAPTRAHFMKDLTMPCTIRQSLSVQVQALWQGSIRVQTKSILVKRLDQTEDYLNERLTANGEVWRLDAKTRIMLGLPPRSSQ